MNTYNQIYNALKQSERFYKVRKTPTGIVFVKRGEPQYGTLDQRFKINIVGRIKLWVYNKNKYEHIGYYDNYNTMYSHLVSSTKRDALSTAVYLRAINPHIR